MKSTFIIPKDEYTRFNYPEEAIAKLKEWKLIATKATKTKKFLYKGVATEEAIWCEVIGFSCPFVAVIKTENGDVHTIHAAYLKEMQMGAFSRDTKASEDIFSEE